MELWDGMNVWESVEGINCFGNCHKRGVRIDHKYDARKGIQIALEFFSVNEKLKKPTQME